MGSNKDKIIEAKWKLFNYAFGDIVRSIRGRALMGAWILSFCFIDYLTYITFGNNGDQQDYKNFIEDKLNPISNFNYHSDFVWALRNALIHTYGESRKTKELNLKYSFTHATPAYHNKFDANSNSYSLNLNNFVFDILKVSINLFEHLEKLNEIDLQDYIGRTQELLFVYNLLGPAYKKSFKGIDNILSPLDEIRVYWKKVENNIFELCLGDAKYYITKSESSNEDYCISVPFGVKHLSNNDMQTIVGTTASGSDQYFLDFINLGEIKIDERKIFGPKSPSRNIKKLK